MYFWKLLTLCLSWQLFICKAVSPSWTELVEVQSRRPLRGQFWSHQLPHWLTDIYPGHRCNCQAALPSRKCQISDPPFPILRMISNQIRFLCFRNKTENSAIRCKRWWDWEMRLITIICSRFLHKTILGSIHWGSWLVFLAGCEGVAQARLGTTCVVSCSFEGVGHINVWLTVWCTAA